MIQAVSMSNNYTKEEVELMQAKAIVELHQWSIEPGEMHENNKTVVEWINKNREIIAKHEQARKRTDTENGK